MQLADTCVIRLPAWLGEWLGKQERDYGDERDCMSMVVELSAENVRRQSGGPFAAAVIDSKNDRLISVGVNLVSESGLSMAHAEMVALSLAQNALGDWNLGRFGGMQLYTSCEPCAMCFGAVPWSGVTSLKCAASKADAEAAGFDEGEKPADWKQALQARGIDVVTSLLREEATEVFRLYRASGGLIYNPGPDPED
ncbi:MAG: nucleoside deaminase [Xanthomonadales bacterium]|nr:nucleoside deaminase [Xanthomonadales bacterium]NNL94444.1 nucleoside deaminase [Xanthomonadales bacterium]